VIVPERGAVLVFAATL
jgi:hypothetical protein